MCAADWHKRKAGARPIVLPLICSLDREAELLAIAAK